MTTRSIDESLEYLQAHGARVEYAPAFLSRPEADLWLERLRAEVVFEAPEACRIRRPFSTEWVHIPRQMAAYGDPETCYVFSGARVRARPWIPELLELRERLAGWAQRSLNFVLIHRYRDGADCMGWHADDERDLGPEPEILSLTLGAARDFQLRHRDAFPRAGRPAPRPELETLSLRLAHGSLLAMRHPTNRDWKHQLPRRGGRRAHAVGERWNLTWRTIERRDAVDAGGGRARPFMLHPCT